MLGFAVALVGSTMWRATEIGIKEGDHPWSSSIQFPPRRKAFAPHELSAFVSPWGRWPAETVGKQRAGLLGHGARNRTSGAVILTRARGVRV